tara:strand:- start:1174 stop:2106 length:933 start_codon:yes stop_codon:yes gene_type:complete
MLKNLCIIGSGKTALAHAKVAKLFGCNIKYIYTRNYKSKNFIKFSKYFKNVKKIPMLKNLDKLEVDGYILCIPWILNDQFVKKFFLRIKKPMLFEKPIGFSDNKIFSKFIYPKNKYIGFNRRFFENIIFLKNNLKFKNILNVEVTISENLKVFKKKFKNIKNKYIIYNTAIHVIDIIFFLFGKIKIIKKIGNLKSKDKNLILLTENPKKIPIYINISHNSPENNCIRIKLKNSIMYELKPIELLSKFNNMKINIINGVRSYRPNKVYQKSENYKYKPGFVAQMENFLYQNRKCNIYDAINTMNFLKKIIS